MYSDHYGLKDRPFQLTPDARYYFESATHAKAMAYLGFGLAQGEGFIVITGEIGAGKSTLVSHLMATIDRSRINVVTISSTQLDADDLLRVIAGELGLATERAEKGQLLGRIGHFLEESAKRGMRLLLIVDEAQNLPFAALEELRMLSNFNVAGNALVQIFLLGQPEFRDVLQGSERLEQLRQRVIATHHLVAMTAEEAQSYIVHRLTLSGWTGTPEITADAFAAMFEYSRGIPRKINLLAGRVLLAASVEKLAVIDGAVVREVIAELESDATAQDAPASPSAAALIEAHHATITPIRAEVDTQLLRRVALLEERLLEQEAMLRRALVLMVGVVERGGTPTAPKERARPSAA